MLGSSNLHPLDRHLLTYLFYLVPCILCLGKQNHILLARARNTIIVAEAPQLCHSPFDHIGFTLVTRSHVLEFLNSIIITRPSYTLIISNLFEVACPRGYMFCLSYAIYTHIRPVMPATEGSLSHRSKKIKRCIRCFGWRPWDHNGTSTPRWKHTDYTHHLVIRLVVIYASSAACMYGTRVCVQFI